MEAQGTKLLCLQEIKALSGFVRGSPDNGVVCLVLTQSHEEMEGQGHKAFVPSRDKGS